MRLDKLVLLAGALGVLLMWATRGTEGPIGSLVVGVLGALLYLRGRANPPWPAPPPTPVRPGVLIPTYNNAGTVAEVVVAARLSGLPVFVIDDGSTDGSGERARAAGATLLTHPVNLGKGAALLTGMRALADAGYSHAICLDADGQHDPADIPSFAEAVRKEPGAIFAGVRDLATAPGRSRFGRRFSNFWIFVETGWRVADSQCGFRAYPLAPVLGLGLGGARYDLEVEVLTLGLWAGVPVRDLPCRVYYPPPEERVSSFRPLVDNARISWMNTLLVLERLLWPPRWFLRVGTAARWSGRSLGGSLGWRLVLGVLRWFGRRPAYAIVAVLARWYLVFARGPRLQLGRYLSLVPAATLGGIYARFGEALVDRMAFLLRGPAQFTYSYEGVEPLLELFAAERGALLLSAHLGNVEVAATPAAASSRFRRIKAVRFSAAGDHGAGLFEALPPEWRPEFIHLNRGEGFAALQVVRELRAGSLVAMHGDRLVDERVVTVRLLGQEVLLPAGPWLVAALADVPVVILSCFKTGPDSYHLIAAPPMICRFSRGSGRDEQIQRWAQTYADLLGEWITRYPDQWFNFHDVWAAGSAEGGRPTAPARS